MQSLRLIIFLLSSFTTALLGQVAVPENEPSSLVDGLVSAITGDLFSLEEDVIVQGAQPLHLKRTYISSKDETSWGIFPGHEVVLPQIPPNSAPLPSEATALLNLHFA